MASSTTPLTITAALPADRSAQIQLAVTDVDNGDWHADLRPDSRVNGFEGATLTRQAPTITRSFSTDATASVVSFTLVGSLVDSPREVFRGHLSFRGSEGWHLTLDDQGPEPFGQASQTLSNMALSIQVHTSRNPAELVISIA
jgi:hypothetical protein